MALTPADYDQWRAQNPDADPAMFFLQEEEAAGMSVPSEEDMSISEPLAASPEQQAAELRKQQPILTPQESLHYSQQSRPPGEIPLSEIAEGSIPMGTPGQREYWEQQQTQMDEAADIKTQERARFTEDTVAGVQRLRPPSGVGGPDLPYAQPGAMAPAGEIRTPGYVPGYESKLKGILGEYVQPKEFAGAQDIETLQQEMDHLRKQTPTIATADRMAQIGNQIKTVIETEEASAKSQVLEQQAVALKEWKDEQKQLQQSATLELEGLKDSYDTAVKNYQTAEIDPKRWNKQHSKVAQSLAIALGGLGAAFTRASGRNAQNEAVGMINRLVDQDIQAQQADLRKKGQNVNIQQNRLAFYKNLLKDEQAAQYAAKAELLEDTQRQLQMKAAEFGGQTAQQNAAIVDAQLSRQALEAKQNTIQRLWGMSMQRAQLNMQRDQMEMKKAAMAAQAQTSKFVAPPGLKLYDPTRPPPTKDDLKIVKKKAGDARAYMKALDEILAFQEEYGGETGVDQAVVKEGEQLVNDAVVIGKGLKGMGAHFTDMERLLIGLAADPTGLLGNMLGGIRATIKTTRKSIETQTGLQLMPYNMQMDIAQRGERQ